MTRTLIAVTAALAAAAGPLAAAAPKDPAIKPGPNADPVLTAVTRQQAQVAIDKALKFLKATQRSDGSWENAGQSDPAVTALAAKCFMQHPDHGPGHAVVRKAMDLVLTFKQQDGGIYPPGFGLRNYYTSVCLMALSAAQAPEYHRHVADAQQFLKKLQWDEAEDIDQANSWYGGAGYGKHKRPDLSNTQMMLEALKQSGLPPSDPTYKKALKFVQRCQMSSASNDQSFARGANDGGFVYTAANGGESKAGTIIVEGRPRLRSYGSMTYAGFKSYLYAELDPDDPRVLAALNWIREHYTLDHNPNMPQQQSLEGLYYYYHVFAKALHAWHEPLITDSRGVPHNWRQDLCHKLISLQNQDGSWVNPADRWYEGNPALVTAYAVLALQTALDSRKQ